MTEEQAKYQAGGFINPGTGHARTCRCDACVEYWERQQVEPDRVPLHDPDAPMVGMRGWLEQRQEPGKKFDHGKPRYGLLPGDVLEEITLIFTLGAEKYGDRNWEQGMSWGRVFGAAMRHMWAFWTGKTTDDESGRPHLAHAIVNLMFLLAYYIRGVGTDDRRADK